jgi:hypothetical protein
MFNLNNKQKKFKLHLENFLNVFNHIRLTAAGFFWISYIIVLLIIGGIILRFLQ